MIPAVGYVRVSREEQAQPGTYSLERQRSTIEQRALQDGFEVVAWFQDIQSGEEVNRRGYQDMLRFLRRKGASRVYVWESSRLGRNDREFLRCCWELEDLGIDVISCTQDLQNVLLRYIYAWKSQEDNRELGRRVSSGKKTSAKKGNWIGTAPFGYTWDPATKRLAVDEARASVVRFIFETYANGTGCRPIALTLNKRGELARHGGPWHRSSVRQLLNNPAYTGGTSNVFATKEATHEGLVPQETWDRVQLLTRSRLKAGRSPASSFLLSRILRCSNCGGPMAGTVRGWNNNHRGYRCNSQASGVSSGCHRLKADTIEQLIVEQVQTLFDPDVFARLAGEQAANRLLSIEPELTSLRKKSGEVKSALNKAFDVMVQVGMPVAEYEDHRARLLTRQSEIVARVSELEAYKEEDNVRRARLALVEASVDAMRTRWGTCSLDEKKAILGSIVQEATYSRDNQSLTIKYRV